MHQSAGYINQFKAEFVCKLTKALYGLKQAPQAWFDKLKVVLISLGFVNSKSDSSLFVLRSGKTIVILLVYIDDILITGNDQVKMKKDY